MGWPSGLRHTLGKRAGASPRRFESCPHRMSESLYKKQFIDIFQTYLRYTNQKEVLIRNIKEKFASHIGQKEEFVFTDLGAGDGTVTREVADFLQRKTELSVHYIDRSGEFAAIFEAENTHKSTTISIESVESASIPSSDFILAAHVFIYLERPELLVKKITSALKKNGLALIVETNEASDDLKLRRALGIPRIKTAPVVGPILEELSTNDIKHQHKVVESSIDFSEVFKMSKDGKAMISFFFHKDFEDLNKKKVERFRNSLKEFAPNGEITKREDYVWIQL